MQTTEAIAQRLEVAEDLRSVVRTMKGLAAATIRQYEEAVAALVEYSRNIDLGLQVLLRHRPEALAGLSRPAAGRPGLIVIGSDQGLCGAFNEHVSEFFLERRAAMDADVAGRPLVVVGTRVGGLLEDAGVSIADVLTLPASASSVAALVQDLLERIDAWRAAGEVDGVRLYFNRPGQGAAYGPQEAILLPLDLSRLRALASRPWRPRAAPVFAGDWDALFSVVVREHLFVTLHRAIAESLASENISRLASMHAAERNIGERLDALRGEFHLHRQTGITSELLEIVSGYEALTRRSAAAGDAR